MTKPVFLSIDDAQLLERVFTVNEPEKLDGIVETVPGDWSNAVIEGEYDLRGQKRPPAKCAHPGRHRHRIGFVCLMPGGARFMVGKDCGKKKHGADLTRMRRVFDAKKDRQYYLSRLSRARDVLLGAMTSLRLALESDCFATFDRARTQLRVFCGDKFSLLTAAVFQNNGALVRYEKVRDHAEEARRNSDEPIFRYLETPMGMLQGREFIAPSISPKERLQEAQSLVREVFHGLHTPSHLIATKDLRALLNKLEKALEKTSAAIATLSALDQFLAPSNLRLVAAGVEGGLEGGTLVREGREFSRPAGYNVPDMSGIENLANAFRAQKAPGAMAASSDVALDQKGGLP